jgi:voltage-gated potassium channel
MTTVGYGDVSPHTDLGRVLAIAIMLIGIGFIAVLTGAVAERFLATEFEEVAEATHEVEATEGDVLAELREVRNRLDRLEARLAGRSRG